MFRNGGSYPCRVGRVAVEFVNQPSTWKALGGRRRELLGGAPIDPDEVDAVRDYLDWQDGMGRSQFVASGLAGGVVAGLVNLVLTGDPVSAVGFALTFAIIFGIVQAYVVPRRNDRLRERLPDTTTG